MKLLIITRKVDLADTSPAGVTYQWIEKIAQKVDRLKVICLEKGEISGLPKNVEIESLGKEKKYGRLRKLWQFHKLARRFIKQVKGVFCHQNPEYTILIAPYAKLYNRKIVSWYTHGTVNWKLHLVNLLTNKILTASKESCRLENRKKIEITGHGIDLDYFEPLALEKVAEKFKIVSIGRISSTKDYQTLIKAIDGLVKKGELIETEIIGGPVLKSDQKYFEEIKRLVKEKDLEKYIKFLGPIPHNQILPYYQQGHLFINLSQTGSIDKAVLEAMACQKLVLTSNEAFIDVLKDERLLFEPKNPQDLAQKIIGLINLPAEEKEKIGQRLREEVAQNHNLDNLVIKIISQFRSATPN